MILSINGVLIKHIIYNIIRCLAEALFSVFFLSVLKCFFASPLPSMFKL